MKMLIFILVAGMTQWAFAQNDPNQRQLEATTTDCEQCRAAQAAQATAQAGNLQSIGDIIKRAGPVQKPFDPDAELEHMQRTYDRQVAEVADQGCGGDDADDDDDRSGGPGGGGPGGMPPGMLDDKGGGGKSKGKPQDMLKKFNGDVAAMDDFLDTQEQMKKDFQKDMKRAQGRHERACAREKASQLADQQKIQMGGQGAGGMGGQGMPSMMGFGSGGGGGGFSQGGAPSIFSQAGMSGGFAGSACSGGDMSSLLYSTMGMSGLASYPSLASCGGGGGTASMYSPFNMMRANRFGP